MPSAAPGLLRSTNVGDAASSTSERRLSAGLAGPVALVVGVFALSRAAAYAAGVRFDASPLDYFWQIVDPDLLRDRLLESLVYLHSQPPAFNALIGAVLKAFPDEPGPALHAIYVAVGLTHALATLFLLHWAAGLGRWTSAAVACVLCVSPAWLTYENWLFYEYPTAALLTLSALLLFMFLVRGGALAGLAFFASVAAVIAFRSVFTPVWLLLLVVLLLLARGDLRRRVLVTCTVAVAATGLLVGKNVVFFGVPSTSSWSGINLAEVVFSQVPLEERRELVERGELSEVSLVEPFSPPRDYLGIVPHPPRRGIPVLDRLGTEDRPNMNNEILVGVSERYFRDSLRLIRLRPEAYAKAVVLSLGLYARPPTESIYVAENRSRLGLFRSVYDRAVLLQTTPGEPSWAIVLGHTLALLYGAWLTFRLVLRRVRPTAATVTLAYVWLTLAYVTVVTGLVQIVENQRIRFLVDTFAVILVAAAARDALAWARARRARRNEASAVA